MQVWTETERTINETSIKTELTEAFVEDGQVRVIRYAEPKLSVQDIVNGRPPEFSRHEYVFPDCIVTDVRSERVRPHVDNESLLRTLSGAQTELRPGVDAAMSAESFDLPTETLEAAQALSYTALDWRETGMDYQSMSVTLGNGIKLTCELNPGIVRFEMVDT